MKKILIVPALAALVAVAACSKHEETNTTVNVTDTNVTEVAPLDANAVDVNGAAVDASAENAVEAANATVENAADNAAH
jgi:hypothetical protein